LKYLFTGYQECLDASDYNELRNAVVQHEKDIKAENTGQLAESILKNFPQFEIMHQSYMRTRIDKISAAVNTIKIIAIIFVVASVISGILLASQIK
jgi:hypothetical protein